jgi:hypothetical protein
MNLGKTEQRLRMLLRDFDFAPIHDVVDPIRDICTRPEEQSEEIVAKREPVFLPV